ncbi:GTP pyrophosphokinase [Proteiniclasticum ruminis]|uniref:Putative GTP pyrophosphokinase n=1 Tax=Proteiniclasticum ruminis TaxID=398199 RepID=A0A1G8IF32_9CLOT|nr:GTP pyrophosphokinase family protein [Proteiniclasticum ruminis]SDI17341.1 putative GTP pyrophosphokinase [Proteiniclasticum ruminis]
MRIANNEISEMEKYLKRIDEDTLNWVQRKSKEVARLMSYYRCAMMEVETKLNVLNEEFSWEMDHNPISSIKKRLKSMPSIIGKLERKGHPLSMENIEEHLMDVAGVRVICSFPEDVYAVRDALIRQDDVVLLEEKDYIKNPKPNGYRSLHLIVGIPIFLAKEKKMMKVEVQLRTIAMDFWASLEHQLRYKKNSCFTKEMAEELTECARNSADLDLRMDAIRKSVEKKKHLEP